MPKQTIEQLKKVIEVLESKHVAGVEAGFEYEANGVRYYTAISHKGAEQHPYKVRLWEDSDGDRYGRCNCAASGKSMLCRHLLRCAELDSELFDIPMYFKVIESYNAHKRFAKSTTALD